MLCEITVEQDYLKAELFNLFTRNAAEETRDALAAVAAEARKRACAQILLSIHDSQPIFRVERSGLLDFFKELGEMSKCRIALTGDSQDLRISQQYVESVARRHGINVRSFPNQEAALTWFKDRRWLQDRRQRQEPWGAKDRRRQWRRSLESMRPA
jgi:hypothetical protein